MLIALSGYTLALQAAPSVSLSPNATQAVELTPAKFRAWETRFFAASDSALVTQDDGRVVVDLRAHTPKSPASTLKILTALRATEQWGLDYRWPTRFVVEGASLTVIGSGDPFLVSEELQRIAQALSARITQPITTVLIDPSAFAVESVPGRGRMNDPYNAPVSAVAANFNTVQLRRTRSGFVSGEAQTPLTEVAQTLANAVARKEAWAIGEIKRVNLATAHNAHTHFAQLLIEFLRASNDALVTANPTIVLLGAASRKEPSAETSGLPLTAQSARIDYLHFNSKPLREMLVGALEYSNNFISNHLFLALGGETPHNFAQAAQAAQTWAHATFGWQDFALVDGAGLSPDNRLSATQMNDVLGRFGAHYTLLSLSEFPDLGVRVFAKTGTLSNVRSLAGYIVTPHQHFRFSYFFNRAVPFRHREAALQDLVQRLALPAAHP